MTLLATIPEEVRYDDTNLRIKWKDGKECSYNILMLRKQCPCVTCRGGYGPDVTRTTENITSISISAWKKVGRYGIQFTWSDNHHDGMYTYDALRSACDNNTDYPTD